MAFFERGRTRRSDGRIVKNDVEVMSDWGCKQ